MRPGNKEAVDSEIIGSRIRFCRERQGLTIKALADTANMSSTALSDIENGRKRIGLTTLVLIADVLNLSLDWLVHGSSPVASYDGFNGFEAEVFKAATGRGENNLLSDLSNRDQMIVLDLIESMKQRVG